jgi:hypothetical protein
VVLGRNTHGSLGVRILDANAKEVWNYFPMFFGKYTLTFFFFCWFQILF